MALKGYVLIETEIGKAGDVTQGVQKIQGVKSADTVAGPYDVLATIYDRDSSS